MKDYIICPNCEGEGYAACNWHCDISECSECMSTLGKACNDCPSAIMKLCWMCQGTGKIFEGTRK